MQPIFKGPSQQPNRTYVVSNLELGRILLALALAPCLHIILRSSRARANPARCRSYHRWSPPLDSCPVHLETQICMFLDLEKVTLLPHSHAPGITFPFQQERTSYHRG